MKGQAAAMPPASGWYPSVPASGSSQMRRWQLRWSRAISRATWPDRPGPIRPRR